MARGVKAIPVEVYSMPLIYVSVCDSFAGVYGCGVGADLCGV